MKKRSKYLIPVILAVAVVAAYFAWDKLQAPALPDGIVSANGRIEATEIDCPSSNDLRLFGLWKNGVSG